VLRLRPGEAVTASDGAGRWRLCRFRPEGRLEPDGPIVAEARPAPAIGVAFALTKGERPEWAVQKLAEAGVDRIVPMVSQRSVVRWDGEKGARQLARFRAVARGAAMQSRRVWLPEVSELQTFAEAASLPAAALAHMDGAPPTLATPTILVGPEGGWDPAELDAGLPRIALAATVLRAETAALAAGILLGALRAGVVQAAQP
jgi:16S rRNA (uracil1498-N3)-methyltransferase